MGLSGTIWIKISKFLTNKKTLNTTKITISQKNTIFSHVIKLFNVAKLDSALIFLHKTISSYDKKLAKIAIFTILAKITNFKSS